MALDRSKRPPRERARQATFLGETEPRAARPLGASLRVSQLGAAGWEAVNANGDRGSRPAHTATA
jgi:hypothetical protein